jgi:hypothetical protein
LTLRAALAQSSDMSPRDVLGDEYFTSEGRCRRGLTVFRKALSRLPRTSPNNVRWQSWMVGCSADVSLPIATAAILSISMACQHSARGFGLPPQWSWILTAIQVLALGLVGQGRATGWLLGAAMQVSWICYATFTDQWGFAGWCILSTIVQIRSYYVSVRRRKHD